LTVLVYSEDYKKHDNAYHPENQTRLKAIMNYVNKEDSLKNLNIISPPAASKNEILKVHTKSHVDFIKNFCRRGGGNIDFDTYATPDTYQIAKISAGGAITASKIVFESDQSAYSIGRPPGHHSNSERSMGFCIFNNIAIAIEYLREVYKIKKFLILDCDVHYGNGTADIFYQDPNVLYISIHQDPRTIFPSQGFVEEIGKGAGEGFNLCIPMPPYSNTSDYIYILEKILKPVASQFNADFHFLDIGFDGHSSDPLSNTNLDDDFYPWITTQMNEIAHKTVLILEGGYNQETLGRCNVKVLNALNNHNENIDYDVDLHHVSEETKSLFKTIEDKFSPFFGF